MPVALLNNEGDGVEIADLEVMLLSSLIPFFSCFVFFKRSFVFEKDLNMLTCDDQSAITSADCGQLKVQTPVPSVTNSFFFASGGPGERSVVAALPTGT